jgi:hypothetical protein
MRFYDVLVNRSVPTEANRGLTSYTALVVEPIVLKLEHQARFQFQCAYAFGCPLCSV